MGKKMTGMKRMRSNMRRKATNAGIEAVHLMLWGEKPKKRKHS